MSDQYDRYYQYLYDDGLSTSSAATLAQQCKKLVNDKMTEEDVLRALIFAYYVGHNDGLSRGLAYFSQGYKNYKGDFHNLDE